MQVPVTRCRQDKSAKQPALIAGRCRLAGAMNNTQEYSLAIATYNRSDSLLTCIRLASQQTRPPAEIVIVDASDDWRRTMERALDEVGATLPNLRWHYQQARIRGLTAQRNQAMSLVTTGVMFMIDDDSFMYPECAEHVMAIYDADRDERVVGVGPMESGISPLDPQPPQAENPVGEPSLGLGGRLYWRLQSLMMVERLLLPYDDEYPDHPVPDDVAHLGVAATRYLGGMRMTWRTGPARQVLFDETLKKYAAAEDMDFSYRISRLGVIVNAMRARLHHAQDSSGRLTRHTRALLGMTNLAYLYKRNGRAPDDLLALFRRRVLVRAAVDLARDLSRGRATLPYVRADLGALRFLPEIAAVGPDQLVDWYQNVQEKILSANRS